MSLETILIILLGTPQLGLTFWLTVHLRKQHARVAEVLRQEQMTL